MSLNSLAAIPPYVFYELDARRNRQRAAGKSLIDVGIGSPDGPIPDVVIEAMQRAAADRALSGYPYFRAHPAYTAAVAITQLLFQPLGAAPVPPSVVGVPGLVRVASITTRAA